MLNKFYNKKYILILLVIIAFIVAAVFSVVNARKKSEGVKFVIGMSQANLTEPWRIAMDKEIEGEAKKYKDLKVIYKDGGGSAEKQKGDINELLNSGVDLLIVSINDSKELQAVVSKAYKEIPVIVLDRAIEGCNYTLYIGPDNKLIGKKAGEVVAKLVGNKKANVIEVQGVLDSAPSLERSQGFRAVIKTHPNIKIEDTVIGEWQRDEVEDDMKVLLKDNKDVDVIFAQNDYMALGAYKAVQSDQLDNVKIVGVDGLSGENGGLDLVSKGTLQATFTCSTGGKEAVIYAMKILNKSGYVPKKVILKSEEITKGNVYR
ncbi:substrate-binding domain-containing protein [Clostridium hydrogenum]|uniref:substrate-binding domain-containing protein n=1 Tax=Clostridium hydrogenum TaxID=2855764 RepID=UPI001F45512E|nr:substrate-binding domain-containing protein [Clostridium hydrogenum]